MGKDVTKRTASASAALLGARVFAKVVDLALMLILARILVPEDFALVALAMIFIQFTESVLEIPVVQALIRTPKVTDEMLHTAFTISLLRGLLLTVLIAACAPLAVAVFSEPRVGLLMVVLAIGPALRGIVNPKLVMFARKLNYVPEASIEVIAKIVMSLIAIPLAIMTKSYWSIAIMHILTPTTMLIGSYTFARYMPRLSLKEWRVFWSMISWQSVAQLFGAINWQVDIFTLGRSVQPNLLGNYSVSQTLAGAPNQVFVVPILRTFVAAFAEIREPEALRPAYLKASSAVFTVMGPILVLIAVLSEPIVSLLFNEQWTEASLFLAILSLSQLIWIPATPVGSVAMTLDKTKYNAAVAFVGVAAKTPLLMLGLAFFGIPGFLAGQLLGTTCYMLAGMVVIKLLLGVSLLRQAASFIRPLVGLAALAGTALLLQPLIDYSGPILLFATAAGVGAAAGLAYCLTVGGLWLLAGRPAGIEQIAHSALTSISRRLTRQSA